MQSVLHTVTDGIDYQALLQRVREFEGLKRQIDLLSSRQKSIRDDLMDLLDEFGEEDDKGHRFIDLPEQCDQVVALVKQRSSTRSLDADAAETVLQEKGLYDECIELVPTLNEDAIMAARYEDRLTDEDIDAMFPVTVSYRFTPKRVK